MPVGWQLKAQDAVRPRRSRPSVDDGRPAPLLAAQSRVSGGGHTEHALRSIHGPSLKMENRNKRGSRTGDALSISCVQNARSS